MRTLYLDTLSGIAGDMTLAALVDCGVDPEPLVAHVRSMGLEDVRLEFSPTMRGGFRALRLDVHHRPEHVHRHLSDIHAMLDRSSLDDRSRDLARRIFGKLAEAEARVHGTTIEQVHFHEVGAVDSIVDIVGVSFALVQLDVGRLVAGPPALGVGTVDIAHGRVSVPAPATAELLRGIPVRRADVEAELTTPTGAAILAALADEFGPVPEMTIERVGYGAGHRDLAERPNILRAIVGQSSGEPRELIYRLEANLDDVSGEQLGFAIEQLWKAGPLDVFTTPITMKKNRPAVQISVLCRADQRQRLEQILLRDAGTLGVRSVAMERRVLRRCTATVSTRWGEVEVTLAWEAQPRRGDDLRIAPEYESARAVAQRHALPLDRVYREVAAAATAQIERLLTAAQHHDATDHWIAGGIRTPAPAPRHTPSANHPGASLPTPPAEHDHGGHDHGGHDHGGHDHHNGHDH